MFALPLWLLALLPIPLILLLHERASHHARRALARLAAPRLLGQLLHAPSPALRSLRLILALAALAATAAALARPQWGSTETQTRRDGLDVILAVDTSRSMLAPDLPPDRLTLARLASQDLLASLAGNRVGLIAFAGSAFLQAPLTSDHTAVRTAIADLDTDIIPTGGTNLAEAIKLALEAFGKGESSSRALILLTDGEELDADGLAAARDAADKGIRILTVGFGTTSGATIPVTGRSGLREYVRDPSGKTVRTQLDEPRLKEIAQATRGAYHRFTDNPTLQRQLLDDLSTLTRTTAEENTTTTHPIERFQLPVGLAIMLLTLALLIPENARRPRALAALAILLLPLNLIPTAPAATPLADAQNAYNSRDYSKSLQIYQQQIAKLPPDADPATSAPLQFNAGLAAFRNKQLNDAAQLFSQSLLSPNPALQADAHYNLAITQYWRGRDQEEHQNPEDAIATWESALDHYKDALRLNPANRAAKDNADFVKKEIERLKNQPPPPPKDQQQQQQQQQDQKDQKDQKDQQNQQSGGQSQDQKDQQDKKDPQNQQNNQQQQGGGGQGQDQQDSKNQQDQQAGNQGQQQPKPQDQQAGNQGQQPKPQDGQQGDEKPQDQQAGNQGQKPENTPETADPASGKPQPNNQGQKQNPGTAANQPGPVPPQEAPPQQGDLQAKNQPAAKPDPAAEKQQNQQIAAAQPGQMTEGEAQALLKSLDADEVKVLLQDRRRTTPTLHDW